jgi:zinc protease
MLFVFSCQVALSVGIELRKKRGNQGSKRRALQVNFSHDFSVPLNFRKSGIMISFEKYILDNGLTLIVHPDRSTPIVAVNVLYNVGARDEDPEHTGFAHLFEHLMFGGSENISKYDEVLQKAGGQNNAFTNNDFTNYYITLPFQNIETAFWLESDRMNGLAFSPKSLEVQRKVVVEEFKQSYLNRPYGDVWMLLSPLAYKVHPYRWNTIGMEISHIENAKMEEVKEFFRRFYNPCNAILTVAGDVDPNEIFELTKKWFGTIPAGTPYVRNLPQEPVQTEARTQTVYRDVPLNALYKTYHCSSRTDKGFYTDDLMSDLLSNGKSSRLYRELVMNRNLFSELDAFISGALEPGLFIISGKVAEGVDIYEAEKAIEEQLEKIKTYLPDEELTKVKNKFESSKIFSEINVLNKAMNLAMFELLGNAEDVNSEINNYREVTKEMIMHQAAKVFRKENSSTLYYLTGNHK